MLASRNTLAPGLILRDHLVTTDPNIDQVRTVNGETWSREPRSARWSCGHVWRSDEAIAAEIMRGAWVRRRPQS